MASITYEKRPRADGRVRYRAVIRAKRNGEIVHRESKTFDKRAQAKTWATRRAEVLEGVGGVTAATVGDVIEAYITAHQRSQPIGRSKLSCLRFLATWPLAKVRATELQPHHLVEHCQVRISAGTAPSTVGQDVAFLRSIWATSEGLLAMPLDVSVFARAQPTLKRLGLVSRSNTRDRRPTRDELDALMDYFARREANPRWRNRNLLPMTTIVPLALTTTRRCGELVNRIRREDIQSDRMLVRDLKHPGEKIGNHVWCYLPEPARPLIVRALDMHRESTVLLPYKADSVSNSWTAACQALGIDDLHFHDLRHEGISWLFEKGWDIPRVAAVSGHRDWNMMRRYTRIGVDEPFDRWADWKWLQV